MRTSSLLFASALLVVGLLAGAVLLDPARADEEAPEEAADDEAAAAAAQQKEDFAKLRKRVEALGMEMAYVRAREEALTLYILENEARAKGMSEVARLVREQGFTQAAIPFGSRETLLKGIEQLAAHLAKDLPRLTEDDEKRLKRLESFRKEHGLDK